MIRSSAFRSLLPLINEGIKFQWCFWLSKTTIMNGFFPILIYLLLLLCFLFVYPIFSALEASQRILEAHSFCRDPGLLLLHAHSFYSEAHTHIGRKCKLYQVYHWDPNQFHTWDIHAFSWSRYHFSGYRWEDSWCKSEGVRQDLSIAEEKDWRGGAVQNRILGSWKIQADNRMFMINDKS